MLYHRHKVMDLVNLLEKIYIQNESSNEKHLRTMKMYSFYTLRITQLIYVIYFLCSLAFMTTPVLIYLIFDVVEYIAPIFIPYVNPEERYGYIVTACLHLYFVCIAGLGYTLADSLLSILIFHVLLCSNLMKHDLQSLNEMLTGNEYEEIELRIHFRNILQIHKEIRL